ncbi:binuclear zinc transcription factor [Podospora didyma]|uniref:Binuclear zinc transcription factor n=1 Tax=Podospora didyma TaxID=330526 RepID=A0AAE0U773_9PEZI|nr:binuclear zinc transcription factor [Podospora didyma]
MENEAENGQPQRDASGPSLSCFGCRNKKLKCDRIWPRCGRCLRLGEACIFPGSRQSQVGKRKKVRDLEAKLNQLEGQIKNLKDATVAEHLQLGDQHNLAQSMSPVDGLQSATPEGNVHADEIHIHLDASPSNELISLGLFEQLPSPQLMEALTEIFFDKLYHASPMLHRTRYTASLFLPPHMNPPMCLQYIVMALAASTDETYRHLATPFYQRARAYAEADEMRGEGEHTTLAHAQCWTLIANFEAQSLMFPRSSTSLCRSIRIAQMLNLHRLDHKDHFACQTLMPPKDWSELEERRRTWWVIFCSDRLASGATGWPALINERDILTLLPGSEEAFINNQEEQTSSLTSALRQQGPEYSTFAGRVLVSHLFHRTLELTSESFPEGTCEDIKTSTYWKRQTAIDNDLATMLMFLPSGLQLPRNVRSQNAVFINIITHTAIISLHRAGLGKARAGHLKLPEYLTRQSQDRLLPAAEEILSIIRMINDVKVAFKNPLMVFAAYMAALVFLDDFVIEHSCQSESSLDFLLNILAALGKTNPVTRSLAIQLAMDMKRSGFDSSVMERIRELPLTPVLVPLLTRTVSDSSNMLFCLLKTYNDTQPTTTMLFNSEQLFSEEMPPEANETTLPFHNPATETEHFRMGSLSEPTLHFSPEIMFQ